MSFLCKLRRVLDFIYQASGALAAVFLFAILAIIVAQMIARATGIGFSGSTDYAGYMMAAASFMAFAYTLNRGGHVRVSILLGRLEGRKRYLVELLCHAMAAAFSCILAWYAVAMVYWSYVLGDVSQGQDATPLWIAQAPVAVGSVVLALCFIDNFISMLVRKQDNIVGETIQ